MIKRPLLFGVAAFVVGEWFGWNPYMAMGLGIAGFPVLFFCMRKMQRKRPERRLLSVLFVCMLLGMGNGLRCQIADRYIEYLEQETSKDAHICTVTGTVQRITESGEKRAILIQTSQIEGKDYLVTKAYRILVYEREGAIGEVQAGNRVQWELELQIPSKPTNPGEFDAQAYYRARGITFLGYLRQGHIQNERNNRIQQGLLKYRWSSQQAFSQLLPEPYAGVLNAMLLGDSTGLDSELKKLYQKSGIAHILAISGLHISILGSILYKGLRKTGISGWGAGIPVMVLLVAYGWMTGFSGSTIRAVIMFGIALGGDMLGRTYDMLTAMGVACLWMLLENPWRLADAGFLLSFGAVFALGGIAPMVEREITKWKQKKSKEQQCEKHQKNKKQEQCKKNPGYEKGIARLKVHGLRIGQQLRTGILLQLITGPIVIYFFYDFPVYGVLLNLIVVPLMTPIIVTGVLGLLLYPWAFGIARIILLPCGWLLELITGLCRLTQKLPGSVWHVGRITIWQMVLYYGILLAFFLVLRYKRKWLLGLTILVVSGWILLKPQADLTIVMLNVGQGDGMLMETPEEKHILIDGGSSSRSHVGEYVLAPAVKYYGTNTLDYIFVSHMDEDHVNGIQELINLSIQGEIKIKTLVVPEFALTDSEFQTLLTPAEQAGIEIHTLNSKESMQIDRITICCIAPDTDWQKALPDKNNRSMVLSVSYQSFDMLLTGDLEAKGEQWILREEPEQLKEQYELLKVGHHGSSGASTMEFLSRVSPDIALISCGVQNRYGHPHAETLERILGVNASIYRTDEEGAVIVEVSDEKIKVYPYERIRRRLQ